MSMAEMTQEELVQEVLDRVLQSSTGVEDLETVTSLSGVKSLPGEKDGKMVNVPLELIGKPASDAAARAEAAAKKAEGAVAGLEEKTQAATEAATKANEAAAKAENAAAKVEQTTAAAIAYDLLGGGQGDGAGQGRLRPYQVVRQPGVRAGHEGEGRRVQPLYAAEAVRHHRQVHGVRQGVHHRHLLGRSVLRK